MSNPYIPANSNLGFILETAYGSRNALGGPSSYTMDTANTAQGSAGVHTMGKFYADAVFPDQHLDVLGFRSFGAGRQWKRRQSGSITREGRLPIVPSDGRMFGLLFGHELFTGGSPNLHLLAPLTPGGTAASPDFTNIVSGGKAIFPSADLIALMRNDAGGARFFQRTFKGTVVEEAEIEIRKGQAMQADLGVMSNGVADQNLHMDSGGGHVPLPTGFNGYTDVAGRPYMFFDSSVTINDGSNNLSIARVERLKTGVKNNMSTQRYLVDGGGQEPFEYLAGMPDFSFDFDMVPAGNLAGDTGSYTYSGAALQPGAATTREAIYDVLDGQLNIQMAVKLAKKGLTGANEDSFTMNLVDGVVSEADHKLGIDGDPVLVNCVVEPRLLYCTMRDAIAQYTI